MKVSLSLVLDQHNKRFCRNGFSTLLSAESWEEFYLELLVCSLQLPLGVGQ